MDNVLTLCVFSKQTILRSDDPGHITNTSIYGTITSPDALSSKIRVSTSEKVSETKDGGGRYTSKKQSNNFATPKLRPLASAAEETRIHCFATRISKNSFFFMMENK